MRKNLRGTGWMYLFLALCFVLLLPQGTLAAGITDYKKCLDAPANLGHPENCACCVLNNLGDTCGSTISNCNKPVGVLINGTGLSLNNTIIQSTNPDCCSVGVLVGSVYKGVSQVTVSNVSIYNWTNGVVFWNSNNSTLRNSTVNNNKNGIYLYISQDIQVYSNDIEHSGPKPYYGVYIESNPETLQSRFYNNHFNNTDNLYLAHQFWENQWNASAISDGPNIIGGPSIGGNYWSEPVGGGYSEICGCSENGFCPPYDVRQDTGYVPGEKGENIDFFPLCVYESYIDITITGSISGWSFPVGTSNKEGEIHLGVNTNADSWTVTVVDALNDGKHLGSRGKLTEYTGSIYLSRYLSHPIEVQAYGSGIGYVSLPSTDYPALIVECQGDSCKSAEYPIDVQQTVEFGDSVLPLGNAYRIVITFIGTTA